MTAVDWPYEDTGEDSANGEQRTIADYLSEHMVDLVINLPLRNGGSYRASSFVTQGYKTRRMAIDYCVPLFTDVKCTKMFVEVSYKITPPGIIVLVVLEQWRKSKIYRSLIQRKVDIILKFVNVTFKC